MPLDGIFVNSILSTLSSCTGFWQEGKNRMVRNNIDENFFNFIVLCALLFILCTWSWDRIGSDALFAIMMIKSSSSE